MLSSNSIKLSVRSKMKKRARLAKAKKKKPMIQRTYEDWQRIGYQVIKGQKSSGRDANGKAIFTELQVKRLEKSMWCD